MARSKSKAITKKKDSAVALTAEFEDDAGTGLEGTSPDDFMIPFLRILQDMSPEVKKRDDAYINGAEPGMLLDTVTRQVYGGAVEIIPCAYKREILEWQSRDSGGGLVGRHPYDRGWLENQREEDGRCRMNGNDLVDTCNHFIMYNADGEWRQAVLSMKSTHVKHSRRWMSVMANIQLPGKKGKKFNPPVFSHIYMLGTQEEQKDDNTWFSPDIKVAGPIEDTELYSSAKLFHDNASRGTVKVQEETTADGETIPF